MEKSVDFVTLNLIGPEHTEAIFSFLAGIGLSVDFDSVNTVKKWKFARVRCYSLGGKPSVYVLYRPTSDFNPTLWVQVMQPTRTFLQTLATFFKANSLAPKIRKIELSFDFFTDEPEEMFKFITSSLFLKNQRTHSNVYMGTSYTNDFSISGNGMRVYIKNRADKTFTRLEYHASIGEVRKKGIQWLLNRLESWRLENCFAFMTMDEARAFEAVVRQFPLAGDPNGTLRERLKAGIGRRITESWFSTEVSPWNELMKRAEPLKDRRTGLKKPERYFQAIPFNALFFDAMGSLRFLP